MSQENPKIWEKPWSTQEMIENASDWSLAGDAGLLKYLEDFSEKMLTKVKDTNDRLNELIDTADETSLELSNATNQFMGLRNTQFIESRVYEDDETLPKKPENEKESTPKLSETERLEEMKQAIMNGLEIIDKYYEKVEIPESDSDDGENEPSIMYQPIDPYFSRPLPYLIGSAEWHKYSHVGLEHSSESSESDPFEEKFSSSDNDEFYYQDLPKRDQTQIPGSSGSENEEILKNKIVDPVAHSTFNDDTSNNKNIFDSRSSSETGSLAPQANITAASSNFAEELAAKLGKVENSKIPEPEINNKPIRKSSNISAGLFSDEPPPLEDDIFVNKNMTTGLFTGSSGLFDDLTDDTDFWKTKPTISNKPPESNVKDELFAEKSEPDSDIFKKVSKSSKDIPVQPKKSLGLFDDEEDDLFNTPSVAQSKKTILAPFKTAPPIFSDEPPELEPEVPPIKKSDEETKRKKPIGGKSVFGPSSSLNQEIGRILKNRAPSSSDSEPENDVPPISTKIEAPKSIDIKKIENIFDDNSPLFSDDIFGDVSTNKFTSNLFGNDKSPPKKKEAYQEQPKKSYPSEPPPVSLFDTHSDEEDLFAPKSAKVLTEEQPKKSGLFDNHIKDDLFRSSTSKAVDIFDSNPPDLDDYDSKSDNQSHLSFENETRSYDDIHNAARSSLFDTEPPLLSNESSGIVKDQSTRLANEDSFLPSMKSSRRESGSIFQENHSNDSIFTSKAKESADTNVFVKPELTQIIEDDTPTKIDITPSGNESSLFNQSSIPDPEVSNNSPVNKSSIFDQLLTEEVKSKETNEDSSRKKKPISLFDDDNQDLFKVPKIPEKSKATLPDSDSEEDLFFNKSSNSKNSSSTSDILKSNPLKTKNIFEDDLFSSPNFARVPDVDLFSSNKSIVEENNDLNTNKLENEKMVQGKLNDQIDKKIFDSLEQKKIEQSNILKTEESKEAREQKENNKFNYEDNLKKDFKTDPKKDIVNKAEEVDGDILVKNSSPGKLKRNFNINVAALLPGAAPPRRHNLEKSTSFDSSESKQSPVEDGPKSANFVSESKLLSFDQPVEPKEILSSANKERAKIQVKRRPSTRRARHEAIRKSAIDLNYEDAIPVTITPSTENISTEKNKPTDSLNILNIANNNIDNETKKQSPQDKLNNPLSPSTDEENFEDNIFGTSLLKESKIESSPEDDSLFIDKQINSNLFSSEDKRNIEKEARILKTEDFQKDFKSLEDDLFASAKTSIVKEENRNIKSELNSDFSKDIFEDDLFGSSKISSNLPEKRLSKTGDTRDISKNIEKIPKEAKPNSSIFSSSDSENDLFESGLKKPVKKHEEPTIFSDEELFKPVQRNTSKPNMLGWEDDGDDIFNTTKLPQKSKVSKKSLFDDEDDDVVDDIFGVDKSSTSKVSTSSVNHSKVKKSGSSRMKKLSTDLVEDIDPLAALMK